MNSALFLVSAMLCAATGTPVTRSDDFYSDYLGQVSSPYDKRMPDRIQQQTRLPSEYDNRVAYRPQQQTTRPIPYRERMPYRYQQQMETALSDLPHFAEKLNEFRDMAQVQYDAQESYAPLYRFKRSVVCSDTGLEILRDHYYMTNTSVIAAPTLGNNGYRFDGFDGYKFDGIACIISTSITENQHNIKDRGLYRSLHQHWSKTMQSHLYRFARDRSLDLSSYTPQIGFPQINVGYCSTIPDSMAGNASVPLHHYYSPRYTDHYYSTVMNDPAANGYDYEGVTCFVHKYNL